MAKRCAPRQQRPFYMDARLCMLRKIENDDVLRHIESYRQPRATPRARMQTTLRAIRQMNWGPDTGGPWVSYSHYPGVSVGCFTVNQCDRCGIVKEFQHTHGPSTLHWYDMPRTCACTT